MRKENPRILYIDDQANLFSNFLEEGIPGIKTALSLRSKNLKEGVGVYDAVIIDASDDSPFEEYNSFSEYVKTNYPEIVVVGTSAERRFLFGVVNEPFTKWYDERVCGENLMSIVDYIDKIRMALERQGFVFINKDESMREFNSELEVHTQ